MNKRPGLIYDFETTTLAYSGQIFDYCFKLVDQKLNVIEELKGKVHISPDQLVSPEAALVTKLDVIEHQKQNHPSEYATAKKIREFLDRIVARYPNYTFIGQNTSRFDLNYLRLFLLRNGFYPYNNSSLTGGKSEVMLSDLIFITKKIASVEPLFRTEICRNDKGEFTTKLDIIAKKCGVLLDEQKHTAEDDVDLTINMLKFYQDTWQLPVLDYVAYEPYGLDGAGKSSERKLFRQLHIDHATADLKEKILATHTFSSTGGAYVLYLDLTDYDPNKKPKENLRWYNRKNKSFILNSDDPIVEDLELIQKADDILSLPEYRTIDTDTYFEVQHCDPQCHIACWHINELRADALDSVRYLDDDILKQVKFRDIQNGIKDRNGRYAHEKLQMLMNRSAGRRGDEAKLKEYVLEKYSGKFQVRNPIDEENSRNTELFEPSLDEYINKTEKLLSTAKENNNAEQIKILTNLLDWIKNTPIYKAFKEHAG